MTFVFDKLKCFSQIQLIISERNIKSFEQFKKVYTLEKPILSDQIHGKEILIVSKNNYQEKVSGYDGFITSEKNISLVIKTADCCPIFIYDTQQQIIAALHAGRKSTELKIVESCIKILSQQLNSDPKNLICCLGPCICVNCYQIDTEKDLHYDLWQENKKQMLQNGVPENNIEISNLCTACNANDKYFSYRRDKTAKRIYNALTII